MKLTAGQLYLLQHCAEMEAKHGLPGGFTFVTTCFGGAAPPGINLHTAKGLAARGLLMESSTCGGLWVITDAGKEVERAYLMCPCQARSSAIAAFGRKAARRYGAIARVIAPSATRRPICRFGIAWDLVRDRRSIGSIPTTTRSRSEPTRHACRWRRHPQPNIARPLAIRPVLGRSDGRDRSDCRRRRHPPPTEIQAVALGTPRAIHPSMSNTKTTGAIRMALKTAGFNARQVTVKDRHYGDIKVTIRDSSVALSVVAELAGAFENIRRCESSGEILIGGTSVDVRYAPEVLEPVAETVEALIKSTEFGYRVQLAGGYTASVESAGCWRGERVYAEGNGIGVAGSLTCHGIRHAANQIAAAYLDSRAIAATATKAAA